ncbi:uncharacterized protein LOC120555294 isoform X6 [Perca fluviatilis]|uniref:uncharacterized protein LOC120555294 isoform X6 n=1 Tax=Perca fluviatilis TaxID=8168 RepID=UPI00196692C1|nr:uncharacterized protein LOC120555294 isoform X6 [Perca fluviatilis]
MFSVVGFVSAGLIDSIRVWVSLAMAGLDKPPTVLVCVLPALALLCLLSAPLRLLAAPLRLLLGPLPAPLSGPSARGIILRSAVLLTTIVLAPSLDSRKARLEVR